LTHYGHFGTNVDPISPELIEQCLGVLQDWSVEAFGEPGERPSAPIWASSRVGAGRSSRARSDAVAPEIMAEFGAEQLPKLHAL